MNQDRPPHVTSPEFREAASPTTPKMRLRELADSESTAVRAAVAANPSTPPSTVDVLAADSSEAVRAALLRNPLLPPSIRSRLRCDRSAKVRLDAIELETDPSVVREATRHEDPAVRLAAVRHPRLAQADHRRLAEHPDYNVRRALLERADVSPEALRRLAGDEDDDIRTAVARHGNADRRRLAELARDRSQVVRDAVPRDYLLVINGHVAGRRYGSWAEAQRVCEAALDLLGGGVVIEVRAQSAAGDFIRQASFRQAEYTTFEQHAPSVGSLVGSTDPREGSSTAESTELIAVQIVPVDDDESDQEATPEMAEDFYQDDFVSGSDPDEEFEDDVDFFEHRDDDSPDLDDPLDDTFEHDLTWDA